MTWFINFCAPFLPNDETINFHRYVQVGALAAYTMLYAIVHFYYLYYGPLPISQSQYQRNEVEIMKKQTSQQNSQNSSQNKDVSIKLDQEQPNDSCVQLKKTGATWNTSDSGSQEDNVPMENVNIQEIERYNSIVYGHFAIGIGLSTLYTPYAQQSIAIVSYLILTVPLLIANGKRMFKTTRFFWFVMSLILMFIFTTGLLEVGQSNWDVVNLDCFANLYTPMMQ